ncbi:MAG: nucleotidyltransferase family protein [Pseudomonadota bacterium]
MTLDAAMVMAAGLGTRMRPLTDNCPKPLLNVAGRTMLDRSLDHVAEVGIRRAVVNVHYLGKMVRDHLAGRPTPTIVISDETDALLDTGGGIVKAQPHLGETFAVLNSDAIWLGRNPLEALLEHWRAAECDALMLFVPRERTIGYSRQGDFFLEGMAPTRRGEADAAPYVFTGAQIFKATAFDGAPRGAFSTNLIWDQLLAAGRLRAVVYDGSWVDVGTPAGLTLADNLLERSA